MADIAAKIIVRNGNIGQLPRLSPGELAYAKDTRRLFIGNDPVILTGDGVTTSFNFGVDLDDLNGTYWIDIDGQEKQLGGDYSVDNFIVTFNVPPADTLEIKLTLNSEVFLKIPPEGVIDIPKTQSLYPSTDGSEQAYTFPSITIDPARFGDAQIRYTMVSSNGDSRKGTLNISLTSTNADLTDSYTTNGTEPSLNHVFSGAIAPSGVFVLSYTTSDTNQVQLTWIEENFSVGANPLSASGVNIPVPGNGVIGIGGGGVAYDQSLNTTDDVQFNSVTTDSLIITGTGTTDIQSGSDITLNAVNRISVTSPTPFRLANMDTATRDALAAPANGDTIYNTDTNKFQGYANGVWVDLH